MFLVRAALAASFCLPGALYAQARPATITGVGVAGGVASFSDYPAPPSGYSAYFYNDGTPAKVCTEELDGSPDNIHWVVVVPAQDCTGATGGFSVTYQPWWYLRLKIDSYTPGDTTTAVKTGLIAGR